MQPDLNQDQSAIPSTPLNQIPQSLTPQPLNDPAPAATSPSNPLIEAQPTYTQPPAQIFAPTVQTTPTAAVLNPPDVILDSTPQPPQAFNTPSTSSPFTSGQAQVGTISGATNTGGSKPKKRRIVIFGALAAVFLLSSAGFVFGFYLPNRPENIWKTGLSRTSDELDVLTEKLSDPQTFETLAKNKLVISGKVEAEGAKASLDVDSRYDEQSSDSNFNLQFSGENFPSDIKLDAAVKTQTIDGSVWPNIYFKIAGFDSLGYSNFLPGINDFNDKWISVEQDLFNELIGDAGEAGNEAQQDITQEDIAGIARDIIQVTQEYVLTDDKSKAILDMQKFVGTEESEGIKANRYKVKINGANSETYCKAVIDKLFTNESYRRIDGITDENDDEKKESDKESCKLPENDDDSSSTTFDDEFDIWIDKKYKLIHKVRLTEDLSKSVDKYRKLKTECEDRFKKYDYESENDACSHYDRYIVTGEKYVEIGQIYKGNNEISMFSIYNDNTDKSQSSFRMDLNVKLDGLLIDGRFVYKDETENKKNFAELTIATEPYDGEIDASKPESSTPIKEVYNYIMQKSQEQSQQQYGAESLGASTDADQAPKNPLSRLLNLFSGSQ